MQIYEINSIVSADMSNLNVPKLIVHIEFFDIIPCGEIIIDQRDIREMAPMQIIVN